MIGLAMIRGADLDQPARATKFLRSLRANSVIESQVRTTLAGSSNKKTLNYRTELAEHPHCAKSTIIAIMTDINERYTRLSVVIKLSEPA